MKHYYSSLIFTVLAVAIGFYIGGLQAAWIVLILGVLETSLSFDNAVVNAKVLQNWDHLWRQRFIMWGIPVAVFGMRLLFPLAIVGVAADLNPWAAMSLALDHPDQYETILKAAHHNIAAFGGAFLMMVFLKFFIDENKELHWIPFLEKPMAWVASKLEAAEITLTLGAIVLASQYLAVDHQLSFILSGLGGLVTHLLADAAGSFAGDEGDGTGSRIIKAGVGGFLYLELLDASFSFDGVVAAFALTNHIFIIMIGLAVGAMFVRSMTIHLVEAGTLTQLAFLEHSAFWAIGALATIMFMSVAVEVPEAVTGLIGAGAIGMGIWSSIRHKRGTDNPWHAASNTSQP